ncbi:hypothetical protein BC829DRAFT_256415 [Chytridium lagenaria]|nr:hypothetical protein BC829DRAFT_256415 [Chytridium lagenaria]
MEVEILRRGYAVRAYDGGEAVSAVPLNLSPLVGVNVGGIERGHIDGERGRKGKSGRGEVKETSRRSCLRRRGRAVSFDSRRYERVLSEVWASMESLGGDGEGRRRSNSEPVTNPGYAEMMDAAHFAKLRTSALTMSQMGATARREAALLISALEEERERRGDVEGTLRVVKIELERLREEVERGTEMEGEFRRLLESEREKVEEVERDVEVEKERVKRRDVIIEGLRDRVGELMDEAGLWEREMERVKVDLNEAREEITWRRRKCAQDVFDIDELCVNPNGLARAIDSEILRRPLSEIFSWSTDSTLSRRIFRELCIGVLNMASF